MLQREDLIQFENEIADLFNAARIQRPFICMMGTKTR